MKINENYRNVLKKYFLPVPRSFLFNRFGIDNSEKHNLNVRSMMLSGNFSHIESANQLIDLGRFLCQQIIFGLMRRIYTLMTVHPSQEKRSRTAQFMNP